jgi:hypothetical protein
MVNNQLRRRPFPFLPQRRILQHGMHILSMKHVVHISPPLLIVIQIIHTHRLPRLPVPIDQLLQHDWVTLGNINPPLVQPSSPVRRAGHGCAYFAGEIRFLVDGYLVACATECDGGGHAADSAANDADI